VKRSTLRRLSWLAPWVLAIGCGGNNTVLSAVIPATSCPSGKGVTISSGVDQNGNGVLDQREVAQTSDVCDGVVPNSNQGTSGFNTLVSTTDLEQGDPNCAEGGTEIQTGVDDGTGMGIAGDGVLQPGEVKSTKYVCNAGLPMYVGSMTPPSTPAGAYKIDTSGGDGTTNNGGGAGYIEAEITTGSLGGHTKVFSTGVADASFTMPAITFDGGGTIMTVAADTALNSYATPAAGITATDAFFQVNNDVNLYANVAGVATIVTGIDVQAGKTLTIAANFVTYGRIRLNKDLRNAGVITAPIVTNNSRSLELVPRNYIGVAGSSISTAGANVTGAAGGLSGYIDIFAVQSVVNEGTITTKGGDGDSGAAGNELELSADLGGVWNKGTLNAGGGTGAVTNGGDGGSIYLYGQYQGVYNAGALNNIGGGAVNNGGVGGYTELNANTLGAVVNSGTITNKGGTCSAVNCSGGSGGDVEMYSYSGALINSADIDTSAATSQGTIGGGSGGHIYMENYDTGQNAGSNTYLPTGDVRVSGNLTTRGGNGQSGGGGGSVYIQLDAEQVPRGAEIILYGYTDMKSKGGNSTGGTGGSGYGYYLYNTYSTPQGGYNAPGGAVINYANVDVRGGDGAAAGGAGEVYLETQYDDYFFKTTFEIVDNHGNIDARGGNATGNNNGGGGGYVEFQAMVGIKNSGTINSSGGTSGGATNTGGGGAEIYFASTYGTCENTAQLDSNGGSAAAAAANGGGAGSVYLYGMPALNSGALNLAGGAGGTNGGDGGYIELFSSSATTSEQSGMVAVGGGTGGTTAGGKGQLFVDGSNMTP
jgi:hypothetical protein